MMYLVLVVAAFFVMGMLDAVYEIATSNISEEKKAELNRVHIEVMKDYDVDVMRIHRLMA